MTRKERNKILDDKIESNVNQYKVDRLNAEISAFSSGDLNKYEFLKRIDLNYKPNVLDKARFEFSPLGKTFNTGLDKTAQGYQEEGITKLLKDIRDSLAGNVIIPARPLRPNDNGNDDNGSDDNGNYDNGNDDNGNDDNGNDEIMEMKIMKMMIMEMMLMEMVIMEMMIMEMRIMEKMIMVMMIMEMMIMEMMIMEMMIMEMMIMEMIKRVLLIYHG